MESSQSDIQLQTAECSSTLEGEFRLFLSQIAQERNWPEGEVDDLAIWSGLARKTWVALAGFRIMGGFTLLEGDPCEFPISKDYPSLCFPDVKVSEVSISGIHKDFRGLESSARIFACMYGSLYWYLIKNRIRYVYAILDRGISALYKRKLGLDFVKIGDNFLKWNEVVFPTRLDIDLVEESLKRSRPEVWDIFLRYQPLDMQTRSA